MNKYENHLAGKDILFLLFLSIGYIILIMILSFHDLKINKELDNALNKIDQQDVQINEYINDNNEKDVYIEWLQDQIRLRDRFEEVK